MSTSTAVLDRPSNVGVKAPVAVLYTSPETVLEDYGRLMRLAEYKKYLPQDRDTALKINISWHRFVPAVSTTPWQMEGVIRTLLEDGYKKDLVHGCHNRTVVVSARWGEKENKQKPVLEKYGLRNIHLYDKGEDWITYEPKSRMHVLNEVYPEGIRIPKRLMGENIIHLPTMKTHVFTTMTGAMKNAFGGLLHNRRHFTHSVIHKTLVDLLAIQKEIHSGIFAVTDGTFAGDGPGPRCLRIHTKNIILASADQVAIDAVSARIMGFDPMKIEFLRVAHEDGLGNADVRNLNIVGEDIEKLNWEFRGNEDTFASRGQKMIYWGPLKPLEKFLLRTVIAPWSYAASIIYHDLYWYNVHGRRRTREAMKSPWGKLFLTY